MNKDEIAGAGKYVEGSAESVLGIVAGNAKTELKGNRKRAQGVAQNAIGRAEDYMCDAIDTAKDHINEKPVQSTLIALAVGFVLGKLFRHSV